LKHKQNQRLRGRGKWRSFTISSKNAEKHRNHSLLSSAKRTQKTFAHGSRAVPTHHLHSNSV
jgi:hypothetical protein